MLGRKSKMVMNGIVSMHSVCVNETWISGVDQIYMRMDTKEMHTPSTQLRKS